MNCQQIQATTAGQFPNLDLEGQWRTVYSEATILLDEWYRNCRNNFLKKGDLNHIHTLNINFNFQRASTLESVNTTFQTLISYKRKIQLQPLENVGFYSYSLLTSLINIFSDLTFLFPATTSSIWSGDGSSMAKPPPPT